MCVSTPSSCVARLRRVVARTTTYTAVLFLPAPSPPPLPPNRTTTTSTYRTSIQQFHPTHARKDRTIFSPQIVRLYTIELSTANPEKKSTQPLFYRALQVYLYPRSTILGEYIDSLWDSIVTHREARRLRPKERATSDSALHASVAAAQVGLFSSLSRYKTRDCTLSETKTNFFFK